jgi:hypothetical protein
MLVFRRTIFLAFKNGDLPLCYHTPNRSPAAVNFRTGVAALPALRLIHLSFDEQAM